MNDITFKYRPAISSAEFILDNSAYVENLNLIFVSGKMTYDACVRARVCLKPQFFLIYIFIYFLKFFHVCLTID